MSVTASEQLREVPIPFWLDHSSDGRAVQYRNKLVLLDCVDKYLSHKMTSLQNANFPNLEILSRTLSRSDSLSDEVDSFKRSVGSAEEFARCLAYNLLFECAPPHLALHKTQELSTSYLNVHPVHFDLLQDFLSGLPRDFRTRFHTLQMPIKAAEAHIQYPSNYHPFGLSYAKNPYWLDAALGISTEEMWQDSLVEVLHVASVISKPSNTDASRALVVQTAGKRSAQTSAGQPRLSFVDPTVVPSDVAEDYDPKRLHDVFNKKTVHFDNSTHLSTEQQAVPDQTQTGGSSSSYVESAASSFSVEDSSASTSEPMASSSSSGQQEEHLFQSKHGASSHSAGTMSASP